MELTDYYGDGIYEFTSLDWLQSFHFIVVRVTNNSWEHVNENFALHPKPGEVCKLVRFHSKNIMKIFIRGKGCFLP